MASTLGLSQCRPGETPQACCFSPAHSSPFSLPGSLHIGEGSLTQYALSLIWGENDDVHYALSMLAFRRMDRNNSEGGHAEQCKSFFLSKAGLLWPGH